MKILLVEDESEINLKKLIDNLLNVHSIAANKKDISILTDIPDTICINSSLPHVISIFDNVITNALKYSYAGGTIRIYTEDLGQMVRICVQDNGVGLTEKDLSRIFEPFFKADPSRHDRSSSGLGLSVTKRLIMAMSNRGIGLLLSPLPRTHRAIFTAIRSGSSLPAFMGAIEKHTNRLLC